ncbi:MAG: AsmA family protein [Elusimicrobia bacterium]|nr:AsmA family protein [Elusimicrobiota bacterium]
MKFPRFRTVLIAVLLTPVVLLAAAAVFIKLRYPPEKLRALALKWAGDNLHRQVDLGEIHLGLSGLDVSKLSIQERAGFPAGVFFSAERLSVQPNLFMLLSGRIVVRSVFIESPRVVLHRRADGVLSIDDLTASSAPAPAPRPTPAVEPSRAAFFVRKVTLRRGQVRWDDAVRGDDLTVKDLTLDLTNVSLATPFDIVLSAELTGQTQGKAVGARVSVDSRLDLPGESLRLRKTVLGLGDSTVTLAGTVQHFAAPQFDIALGLSPFLADSLSPWVALPAEAKGASVKGDLKVNGSLENVALTGPLTVHTKDLDLDFTIDARAKPQATPLSFDAKASPTRLQYPSQNGGAGLTGPLSGSLAAQGTADRLGFSVNLDLSEAELRYGDSFVKPAKSLLKITAAGAWDAAATVLKSFKLESPVGAIDGQGALRASKNQSLLDFTVSAPALDLGPAAALVPALRDYSPRGKISLNAKIQGTTAAPQAKGNAVLSGVGLTPLPGASLESLGGSVAFSEDDATLKDFKGKFLGSPFSLALTARRFSRPELTYDFKLDRLDLAKVQEIFSSTATTESSAAPAGPSGPAPIARAEGSIKIGEATHPYYLGKNFQLKGLLTDLGPDLGQLSGALTLSASDGKIRNLPLAEKINKLMKKDSADLTYKTLGGHLKIDRGLLTTEDLAVESDQTDLSAKGRVRLTDYDSDLRATIKLPAGSLGGSLGDWTSGPDGRPTLTAKITGPLTDPKISVDFSQAAKNAAKDLLQKSLEKYRAPGAGDNGGSNAVDKAVDQGLKSLQKLFKKK